MVLQNQDQILRVFLGFAEVIEEALHDYYLFHFTLTEDDTGDLKKLMVFNIFTSTCGYRPKLQSTSVKADVVTHHQSGRGSLHP